MTTKKVTAKDGEAAIAMLDREHKSTGYTTELRRCVGSTRFGIEPHEAPIDAFPMQPSQKDGLGRMCQGHWRAYTSGLHKDALARKTGEAAANDEAHLATAGGPKTTAATTTTRTRKPRTPSPKTAEVERAEMLIAVVGAMPADQMVKRVGDADVQAALEVTAAARMTPD